MHSNLAARELAGVHTMVVGRALNFFAGRNCRVVTAKVTTQIARQFRNETAPEASAGAP